MDKKKIAAASAAVFAYIKTQEEAAYYAAANADNEVSVPTMLTGQSNQFSAWTYAGRLNQMQQNTMMLMQVR